MIPKSKDELLKWIDPDDGAVFEIAPAIGDNELVLYEAIGKIGYDTSPFIEQAEKQIKATEGGKRWKKDERDKAVSKKAQELARKDAGEKGAFSKEEMRAVYDAVDVFVISCTPKGQKKISFNGEASQNFTVTENSKLISAIFEVNRVGEKERKN